MLHKTKKNLVILTPKNDIGMDNILRFSGELTSLYYSVSVMAEFLQTSRLNTVHDRVWFKMWNTWEKSVIWPDIILCDPLDSYLGNIMFHSNGSITKTSLWCLSLIWQVHHNIWAALCFILPSFLNFLTIPQQLSSKVRSQPLCFKSFQIMHLSEMHVLQPEAWLCSAAKTPSTVSAANEPFEPSTIGQNWTS